MIDGQGELGVVTRSLSKALSKYEATFPTPDPHLQDLVVGKHVYVKGSGKWWAGEVFGSVIVDIRHEDRTIKIRYTDGGWKRFREEELRASLSSAPMPATHEEWGDFVHEGHTSEMRQLHDDIMAANTRGNTATAHEWQERFARMSEREDQINELKIRLTDAVRRGDYLLAHEVQQNLHASLGVSGQKQSQACSVFRQAELQPLERRPTRTLSDAFTDTDERVGVTPASTVLGNFIDDTSTEKTWSEVMSKAASKSLGGGLAGAGAMALQVITLMWMRTVMNYQYRYGTSAADTFRILYRQQGVRRFYRGLLPALVQGPASRCMDTASNAGVMEFFDSTSSAKTLPAWVRTPFQTLIASGVAAGGRIFLVPVDTMKTIMQVEGRKALTKLGKKYRASGSSVFFHGGVAIFAATFVGHYPWFMVFNTMNEALPQYDERHKQLMKNALIGFSASVCSDTVSNSLRVVKTYRQTNATTPYSEIARAIVKQDGVSGLFGRGLRTRIVVNGVQGITFSVLYRLFEEKYVQAVA